jgi:hypothetical protein
MEVELFKLYVSDSMLVAGSNFLCSFAFSVKLTGNCEGRYKFILRRGTLTALDGPDNFSAVTWDDTIVTAPILVTSAEVTHKFGFGVVRGADVGGVPAMTATKTTYDTSIAATAPALPKFLLQARLIEWDTNDVPDPTGQVTLTMIAANCNARIVKP